MAILEKEVWVSVRSRNIKHYGSLGYKIIKKKDKQGRYTVPHGTKILVKINDIASNSVVKVTKICDCCGEMVFNQTYQSIIQQRIKGDGLDRCYNCGRKISGEKAGETRLNNVKYDKSLEYYAIQNDMLYLLDEFSIKNKKLPTEVNSGSHKEYLWKCGKCKKEYKTSMRVKTKRKCKCPYCTNKKVVLENCLFTTHPEIANLLKFKDKAFNLTFGSDKKEIFKCNKCGHEKICIVGNVVRQGFSCSVCSDGLSYPEKFISNLLTQLNIEFDKEKGFKWSDKRRYDFYIPFLDCIVEVHGKQHYNGGFSSYEKGKDLYEEEANDKLKENVAKMNGIKEYIVINCSLSEMDYIKTNIINSKMSSLFDLSDIDWLKCHEFACGNLIQVACSFWNNGLKNSKKIGEEMNITYTTVGKYLKQGSLLNWCDYDPKQVKKEVGNKIGGRNKRKVIQLSQENEFINEWKSISHASMGLNTKTTPSSISAVCKGRYKTAGGYKWMYKEDYEKYIAEQNKELVTT